MTTKHKNEPTEAEIKRHLAACNFELTDADGVAIPIKARSITLFPSGRATADLVDGTRLTFGEACRTVPGNSKFFRIVEVRHLKIAKL